MQHKGIIKMLKKIINFLFSCNDPPIPFIEEQPSEADTYYLQALQYESLCMTLQQLQAIPEISQRLTPKHIYQRNAVWNYLSAGLRGHMEAQYRLGVYYLHGKLGLDQNDEQARLWLDKAKQQNHSKAAQLLSEIES